MTKKSFTLVGLIIIVFTQCNQPQGNTNNSTTKSADSTAPAPKNATFTYRVMSMKDSGMANLKKQFDTNQLHVICALNRVDMEHLPKLDTIIVPDNVQSDLSQYSPYPQSLPFLKDVKKIIFFSYPAQAFGAYENGRLVRWGPTSMGRKKDPTPTGLTYVNWKKKVDTSSVKDEWILKWNVNILNKGGVGFHEYALPGYPASHSCLRLLDNDAEFLYNWADQWIIKGQDDLIAHGTPVEVFGSYPFGGPKPWLALPQNAKALDISAGDLQQIVQPMLSQIITEQQKLQSAPASKDKES